MAYVAEDGSYGGGQAIIFPDSMLTDQEWENLDNLSDSERYAYVCEILEMRLDYPPNENKAVN